MPRLRLSRAIPPLTLYTFMTWTETTETFYFCSLHATSSVIYSGTFRLVNGTTSNSNAATFKNLPFCSHNVCVYVCTCRCVCVCFPRVLQQEVLLSVNSITWLVLSLENDCVLCEARTESLSIIWRKFRLQNVRRRWHFACSCNVAYGVLVHLSALFRQHFVFGAAL
jgi:hypothetical protein